MEVTLARIEDLEEIASLFDRYRIFYRQPSDLEAARNFLKQRFDRSDARIFVSRIEAQIVGFTQLYPSFSSVAMKPV
jgi:hypothetical protein